MEQAQAMLVRPILYGAAAFVLLLVVYFAVVGAISGIEFTLDQFYKFWYFLLALALGFARNLNDDLAKAAVLLANGKRFAPLTWEGAPPGGHHRKGFLRFNAITPQPQSVELQIHLGGEPAARTFRWSLKGTSNGH